MDLLTLALAKSYTDSQRLGYAELEKRRYGWVGDTSGLNVFPGEVLGVETNFYRVSEDIILSVDNFEAHVTYTNGELYVLGNVSVVEETDAILVYGSSILGVGALHIILLKSALSEEIPAGVYFAKNDDCYVSWFNDGYVETIHPIDQKYVNNIIDLTKFNCTYNGETVTFNDALFAMLQASLQGGGSAQIAQVDDIDGSLKKAASGTGNVKIRTSIDDDTVDFPVMYAFDADGAGQMSCSYVSNIQNIGYMDTAFIIQFTNGDTETTLFVRAELISA